jgi:hypothetical protein
MTPELLILFICFMLVYIKVTPQNTLPIHPFLHIYHTLQAREREDERGVLGEREGGRYIYTYLDVLGDRHILSLLYLDLCISMSLYSLTPESSAPPPPLWGPLLQRANSLGEQYSIRLPCKQGIRIRVNNEEG